MMQREFNGRGKGRRIGMFVMIGTAAVFGVSAIVMLLWNAVLPPLTGVKEIGYWQAMGLLALCKILFGGFGPRGRGRKFGGPQAHLRERWMNMTDEEKLKFREEWRKRCNR